MSPLDTPKVRALLACARTDAKFVRRDPWRRYEVLKQAAGKATSNSTDYTVVVMAIAKALGI